MAFDQKAWSLSCAFYVFQSKNICTTDIWPPKCLANTVRTMGFWLINIFFTTTTKCLSGKWFLTKRAWKLFGDSSPFGQKTYAQQTFGQHSAWLTQLGLGGFG